MSKSPVRRCPSAWAEIDLGAIRHNFREVRKLARRQLEPRRGRDVDILSVVKADAYGHGMIESARAIAAEGGRYFAVSNVGEGAQLRASGFRHPVICFEATLPEIIPQVLAQRLTPAVCTLDFARELDRQARRRRQRVAVHVKVDTGMGRLGVWHEEAADFVRELTMLRNLRVEGLFTHFPLADSDEAFTLRQVDELSRLVARLIERGVAFNFLHAANSMGLGGYKNRLFNLARPGIMLYGLYPGESARPLISLKPAMSVKARVIFIKTIKAGSGVSYGHTFTALNDIPAAVLAIGYSDGYVRDYSNRGHVLINGVICPVLGRVTMDQTIVDISLALRAGKVCIGDEAVIMGVQRGARVTADDLATWAGTINYEVVCQLGLRLPRVIV